MLFINLVFISSIYSQFAFTPCGGDIFSSNGSISFTIGQIADQVNSSNLFVEIQGVQQPHEISIISSVPDFSDIDLSAWIYPNPTSEMITLKLDNHLSFKLNYILYNVAGEVLGTGEINENETLFSMKDYLPSLYLLIVYGVDQKNTSFSKYFKITKI
jgi:hypothetical protein